ncbi:MAG: hypothetical protein V7784_07700 [Oceanospirillaceae bacterium]
MAKFFQSDVSITAAQSQLVQQQLELNAKTQQDLLKNLQLSQQQDLKEQLSQINRHTLVAEKINDPAFSKGAGSFGVLDYVDTTNSLFEKAKLGIQSLQAELIETDESLLAKTKNYVENLYQDVYQEPSELNQYFEQYFTTADTFRLEGLADIGALNAEVGESHEALFKTGVFIKDDIRVVQKLRTNLVKYRASKERRLKHLQSKLANVEHQISEGQSQLSTLNNQRLKSLSDYHVVNHLVSENWQKIENDYRQRAQILDNNLGISYLKVRETPLNRSPSSLLSLQYASVDDLVPGCPLEDKDLPVELEAFMESMLDIPMSDWQALHRYAKLLPDRRRIQRLIKSRQQRINYKLQETIEVEHSLLSVRMQGLFSANKALLMDIAQAPASMVEMSTHNAGNIDFTVFNSTSFNPAFKTSLLTHQQQSAKLISLEDLLTGSPHRLRGYAENLRNKLDQACHCLITQLREIAPSIRLQWAAAAELDQLIIDKPQQWPGLEQAEKQEFNTVRTIIALVQWWFRQLSAAASTHSYSALRNMIRAVLLVAAADDPNEILHGNLLSTPKVLEPGGFLRVSLNREAQIGTLLQLMDDEDQFVGTLRVEDVDDEGAVVMLMRLQATQKVPNSLFSVTGFAIPGVKR